MDRKQWLTMVYREANIFLERNTPKDEALTAAEINEFEPELSTQLQEVLRSVEHPEDLIKHSLLKTPPPDLWYGEGNWQHVLLSVALACLVHDVKGVALKIAEGALPQTPSGQLLDPL
jgi:hypothetical protein